MTDPTSRVGERVAVLGGSFDPPHLGHVLLGAWALSQAPIDRLMVVPTYAHAFGKRSAPFEHRARMAELAFEALDARRVEVSRIEERLPRPSYTVQLLEALHEALPGATFRLLVGADLLASFGAWRSPERVVALAPLLVAGRKGHPRAHGDRQVDADAPDLPEISSTRVRERLERCERVDAFVPASVVAYLRVHDLYGAGAP